MKKIIFVCSIIIVFLNCDYLNAQWSPLKRLTSGYKDTNPSFNSLQNYGVYAWEFMVFQRQIDSASRICVLRLNNGGLIDSAKYLTTDNYLNRNPCIAYKAFTDTIKTALVMWESNKNGRWDIYGSYYTSGVWTNPFIIDSSSGNKSNPKAIQITATDFGITYSKEGEVIYRKINAAINSVINETNLTASISGKSDKSVIGEVSGTTMLNFRVQKEDSTHWIYSISSTNNGDTWLNIDTVSKTGDNSTLFILRNYGNPQQVFESKRYGKSRIYSYYKYSSNVTTTDSVFSSSYFDYYGLKSWMFPFVFDSYVSHVNAVVRKSNESTVILLDGVNPFLKDSVNVGDSSKHPTIALNNGVRSGLDLLFFAVFDKDTAAYTSLYYKTRIYVTGNITQTGNYFAEKYSLHQNYPNPFNPITKIKFDIPKISDVKITIYDALGKEVSNIFKAGLTTGSYEYEFSGENLSSGVYYYRFETKDFSKTMKMILLK